MIKIIFAFSILVILVGCSYAEPINNMSSTPNAVLTGYPIDNIKSQADVYPALEELDREMIKTLSIINLPDPVPGMASVTGVLINFSSSTLMKKVDIYLTKAVGQDQNQVPPILAGAFEERGDVKAITNEYGQFTFSDIPPGNYFLVLSMDLSLISVADAITTPLLIRLKPDTTLSLGDVYYNAN